MTDIHVRRMTPDDADAVSVLEKRCFSVPWSRASFWEEASQKDACYLVALAGEEIIGYAGVWILGTEGHISNVAVDPAHRGQGIGSALLENLIRAMKERGAASATLEMRVSNDAARKLYEKYGFKSVGIRPKYYTAPVEDADILWNTKI
ncbi:ribosomal protein S18-alanine N-acetyltransferase [Selenomonas sp. TAMA-11512]|uniref:ribosomal protein S18-alanine N-acetyltransferase n=1 Tax=Selenomonas sp. TAMA-11512 TaxID=3095337 RepID=UPI00308DA6F8|nr:ribosomal protein S18-alanine N-acetyltransferase [Selenomonas sp. TAMA-11512]